jgi:hypothetical protein
MQPQDAPGTGRGAHELDGIMNVLLVSGPLDGRRCPGLIENDFQSQ